MQTKSNIQIIRENLAKINILKENIESLMDKYIIEDSFFGISQNKHTRFNNINECISEYSNGYFVIEHEYTNIDEAVSNMGLDNTLRVINNEKFQIGKRFEKLSEITEGEIIDITTGELIKND